METELWAGASRVDGTVVRGDRAAEVEVDWLKKSFERGAWGKARMDRVRARSAIGSGAMRVGGVGAFDVFTARGSLGNYRMLEYGSAWTDGDGRWTT